MKIIRIRRKFTRLFNTGSLRRIASALIAALLPALAFADASAGNTAQDLPIDTESPVVHICRLALVITIIIVIRMMINHIRMKRSLKK